MLTQMSDFFLFFFFKSSVIFIGRAAALQIVDVRSCCILGVRILKIFLFIYLFIDWFNRQPWTSARRERRRTLRNVVKWRHDGLFGRGEGRGWFIYNRQRLRRLSDSSAGRGPSAAFTQGVEVQEETVNSGGLTIVKMFWVESPETDALFHVPFESARGRGAPKTLLS